MRDTIDAILWLFSTAYSLIFGEWWLGVPYLFAVGFAVYYLGWDPSGWMLLVLFVLALIYAIGCPLVMAFIILLFSGMGGIR